MAKYRKKPLTVTVERAKQQQYVTTLEGVSEAKRGDYILTGVDSEQWVVKPKWFNDAYTHIAGNQYRRKPQVLEAEQIDEPEVVSAPTGDIKGDKGDYKLTGKSGEQWFVKPDIFEKTYDKVAKSMTNHPINDVIKSIGMDAVTRYIPKGMKLHNCDIHGFFLAHYTDTNPICSLCVSHSPEAEGTTATQVEHYIDIRDALTNTDGTNPGQKANPLGISPSATPSIEDII